MDLQNGDAFRTLFSAKIAFAQKNSKTFFHKLLLFFFFGLSSKASRVQ